MKAISFSTVMQQARRKGLKTMTRRMASFTPLHGSTDLSFSGLEPGHYCTGVPESGFVLYSRGRGGVWNQRTKPEKSPYGLTGAKLYVKEAWRKVDCPRHDEGQPPGTRCRCGEYEYKADGGAGPFKSGRFMPAAAARDEITLTDVRVERLHAISAADIEAEGTLHFASTLEGKRVDDWCRWTKRVDPKSPHASLRGAWALLWETVNGPGSYAMNPWVWVLSFPRFES